jgi:hypothetical protein
VTWQQRGDRIRALEAGLNGLEWRERRFAARPGDEDLRNQLITSLSTIYDIRVEMARAASKAGARQRWQQARATIGRISQLQEDAIRAGATPAGPDRASVTRELEKCDAALARLSHAP